jgi:hypothetical protein
MLYVAGGATSHLFLSCLPSIKLAYPTIYATVRNEDAARQLLDVQFIDYEEARSITFSRVLWFSTQDDCSELEYWSRHCPTLAISSAAVLDVYLYPEVQPSPYQLSKLKLHKLPDIWTFCPGFFINDTDDPSLPPGLHGETNARLWSKTPADASEWWNKAYAVSPKSIVIQTIQEWLANPSAFRCATSLVLCSDTIYTRRQLRRMGVGEEEEKCEDWCGGSKYGDLTHARTISHTEVARACRTAAAHVWDE